jgi:hypothetical protein
MPAVLQPERKEAPLSATDLSPLVPPWPELERAGEVSHDEIVERLERECSAAREWSHRAAELLVIAVGNWVMLSEPPPSEETVNRLNRLLGQFDWTESRRFG